jgi:hypothetical protein
MRLMRTYEAETDYVVEVIARKTHSRLQQPISYRIIYPLG